MRSLAAAFVVCLLFAGCLTQRDRDQYVSGNTGGAGVAGAAGSATGGDAGSVAGAGGTGAGGTGATGGTPADSGTGGTGGTGGQAGASGSGGWTYRDQVLVVDQAVFYLPFDDAPGGKLTVFGSQASSVGPIDLGGVVLETDSAIADGSPITSGRFDGTDQLSAGTNFNYQAQLNFSLEAWIKLDDYSPPLQRIFLKKNTDNNGYELRAWQNGGGIDIHFFRQWACDGGPCPDNVKLDASQFPAKKWHHVVATHGSSGVCLYVRAVDAAAPVFDCNKANGSLPSVTEPMLFGSKLTGLLDELAIYDKELSQAQITAHFNAKTK